MSTTLPWLPQPLLPSSINSVLSSVFPPPPRRLSLPSPFLNLLPPPRHFSFCLLVSPSLIFFVVTPPSISSSLPPHPSPRLSLPFLFLYPLPHRRSSFLLPLLGSLVTVLFFSDPFLSYSPPSPPRFYSSTPALSSATSALPLPSSALLSLPSLVFFFSFPSLTLLPPL